VFINKLSDAKSNKFFEDWIDVLLMLRERVDIKKMGLFVSSLCRRVASSNAKLFVSFAKKLLDNVYQDPEFVKIVEQCLSSEYQILEPGDAAE